MKYVFLNPDSCSGLAVKKWQTISRGLKELSDIQLVDNYYELEWNNFNFRPGDMFLSAGGDGTIHSMVNGLILNKGLEFLTSVKIGHVGIGSNNSFLRPYENYKSFQKIPYAISEDTYKQDLIRIQIDRKKEVICVANSSIGFLANANKIFNTSSDVGFLKKINPDLADSYTVIKTLSSWKSFSVKLERSDTKQIKITNVHIMKKPFYASDLRFPEEIISDSGKFHLNILYALPKREILSRFISLMTTKNYEAGRDYTEERANVRLESDQEIPLEVDGEIYTGREFSFHTLPGAINLCR